MQSFALKTVWFVLAVLGIPATWIVLLPFSSVIGVRWAPMLYCISITVLEGIFSLGMIWKMDPYRMPHAFCVTQAVLIALAAHVLTGLLACFTWATFMAVFKPHSIHTTATSLAWRNVYIIFVGLLPALASTAHLVIVLKLDAVQPTDDMHCDASYPLWPRVLSYAGAPLLISVPCFVVSIFTAVRVVKVHAEARRYRYSSYDAHSALHSSQKMHTSQMSSRSFPKATRKESLNFLNTTVKTADNPRREVDVHLPHNMTTTQCSSHASLPSTTPPTPKTTETTFASSSVTQLDPPPVHASSLNLPAPPSPTMSNKSSLFSDRAQTPSPITFAPVPLPARRPPEMTETSYLPSFPDPGALVFPAPAPGPDGSTSAGPASPTSPSRVRASLDEADVRRGFHLPMPRSLDAPLRPSFELSTEYAKARLQQDMSDPPTASSSSGSGYPPLTRIQSHSQSLKDEDDITVETVGFKDRPLDKLREEEEEEEVDGDRRSVLKEGLEFNEQQDHDVVTMRPIPRARQFYRSARQSIRRPLELGPAIWRLVVFQLAFFFILVLAALSTLIDLGKDQTPSHFGTQHIALLLAAWGPLIVFGHLPGVRGRLFPCSNDH